MLDGLVDARLRGGRPLRGLVLACALLAVLLISLGGPRGATAQAGSHITLSYKVIGGGSYEPPIVWYFQNGVNVSSTLSVNATTFAADAGTTWVAPMSLGGGESYLRYELAGNNSGTVEGQTVVLTYYTQYYATFGLPPEVLNDSLYLPTVNYTSLGVGYNISAGLSTWADYLAPYTYNIIPTTLQDARWFCPSPTGVIEGAFAIDPGYVEQYLVNLTMSSTGTQPLHSANFTEMFDGEPANQTIGAHGRTLWVDAYTTLDFQPTITSQSGTNQWVLHSVTPSNVTAPSNVTITYFEQYPLSVSYSVVGGEAPSGPIVSGSSNGNTTSIEVYPGSPARWVDAGSQYSLSSLLVGSTPNERWITTATTEGVVNGPMALTFEYQHQVLMGFSYSIAGGGEVPSSNVTFFSFGVEGSLPLSTTQASVWVDFGTTMNFRGNFSGGTPAERWMLGSAPSLVVSTPEVLSLVYYHQFLVPTGYTLVGGGSPPAPVLAGSEFGVPLARSITSGSSVWLDGGSTWSVPGILQGGTGERWVATGHTNGTVTSATFPDVSYEHQYYVAVVSNPAGSASLTPNAWVRAGQSVKISEEPSDGWAFEGWLGSGQGSYSGTNQTFSLPVSAPLQETASLNARVTIRVAGSGSLIVTVGSHSYPVSGELTLYVKPGTNISLAESPGTLRSFKGWQGISAGSASAVLFTVAAPLSVTASFGVNLVLAILLVAVVCGAAISVVAYVAWRTRVSTNRRRGSR